jgi:hypothetical protein
MRRFSSPVTEVTGNARLSSGQEEAGEPRTKVVHPVLAGFDCGWAALRAYPNKVWHRRPACAHRRDGGPTPGLCEQTLSLSYFRVFVIRF